MIKFNDVYVSTLARGLCQPNEQFIAASAGSYQSFWTFKIPLFRHNYLLLATSDRLVVIDHRRGLLFDRMDQVQSFRWSEIGSMKLGGMLSKKLVVKDASNRVVLNARLPKLFGSPIPKAKSGAQVVMQTWEQRRQLGAAPAFGQLPPQAGMPQMQAPLGYSQVPASQQYGRPS
jgi:hypothetical protein